MKIPNLLKDIGEGIAYLTPYGAYRLYSSIRKYGHDRLPSLFPVAITEPLKLSVSYDMFNQLVLNSKGSAPLWFDALMLLTGMTVQYGTSIAFNIGTKIKSLKSPLQNQSL